MGYFLKKFILATYLLTSISCVTPHQREPLATDPVSAEICEKNLEEAFRVGANPDLMGQVQQASGTFVSYVWTGANYTTEFLWDVAGGTLVLAALCGPVLVAQMASSGNYEGHVHSIYCLPGKVNALSAPRLGEKAFRDSASLRCPDLAVFSERLRKAIDCIPEDFASETRRKMHVSLRNLMNSGDLFSCLDGDLKARIAKMSL